MKFLSILFSCILIVSLFACEDSSNIGNSTVQDEIEIVVDSDFSLTGHTVYSGRVQSRTATQLLGIINAKGYGYLKSDIVTQFMPANVLDTTWVKAEYIDSIKLLLQMPLGSYVGDSVVPMGLNVYRLNKQLTAPIYSDFDPTDYYSESDFLGSAIYTSNALGETDSVAELTYRTVYVDLPVSLGVEFFNKYKESPQTYSSPTAFAEFFPGMYITNSYGSGRVIESVYTQIKMYYHSIEQVTEDSTSTTYSVGNYFAVTPEIITNNNIDLVIDDEVVQMVDNGDNVILAPAGMDVEITFPGREIVDYYRANSGNLSVINSLTLEIPVEEISNTYGIDPPPYLLLVKTNEKDEFFANDDIIDNKTSFYAEYDSSSKEYIFSDMRSYAVDIVSKDEIKDEDITFTITPISITTESDATDDYYYYYYYYYYTPTEYITDVAPYVEVPAMAKLLLGNAKIKFTFSKQTIDF